MIKKLMILFLMLPLIFGFISSETFGNPYANNSQVEEKDNNIKAYKRGAIRSPRRGYNPGIGTPGRTSPTRSDNTVRNPTPTRTTPATRTGFGGFFGGLFGGLALGSILGSLFNPFAGFSLGVPFLSLLSLAFWIIIILIIIRLFRGRKEN